MIRFIDFIASLLGLIVLSPLFLVIAIWIKIDDRKGGVFYKQMRVGKDGVDFGLYKFRSMYVGSDKKGLITIGGRDPRITRSGYYIRKFKLDELPQLINVLKGDMSMVGPRPEVRKYVDLYTEEQRHVLDVRPGITDYASIEYLDENALLALSDDPDRTYVEEIMPAKIRLNMKYIRNQSLKEYLYIILKTFSGISVDKLVNWYFSKASLPYWGVLVMDIIVSITAVISAYAIINGPGDLSRHFWQIMYAIITYVPLFCLLGKWFHTYEIQYRYTSIVDLEKIFGTMLSGSVIIFTIRQIWNIDQYTWKISGLTMLLAALLATLLMMIVRIVIKSTYDSKKMGVNMPLAVIYGTQENVEILSHAIQNLPKNPYRVWGYFTDDAHDVNHFIMGKKMLRKDDKLVERLVKKGVEAVICGPLMSKKIADDQALVAQLNGAGIKIMVTPEITHMERNARGVWSNLEIKQFEFNEIDLLPHVEIEVVQQAISHLLCNKTVLVTGAAGNIGSELVRQIAACQPKQLVLIDQAETPLYELMLMLETQWPELSFVFEMTSIVNSRQMERIFKTYHPEIVLHAAAVKQVRMLEQCPSNAVLNNCIGTRIVADMAVKYRVEKFILISTEKAIRPTTVVGMSKRIAEIYCQSLNAQLSAHDAPSTQFVAIRFGKVLGANESVIPIFRNQIKQGGPVKVSHPEKVRYYMLIADACKLILQACTMGTGGEVFAFDMGEPVRIADLARKMIEMSGAKDVKIEYTGLREGEKLAEEVKMLPEDYLPTSHPKIRLANETAYSFEEVRQDMNELEELCKSYDEAAIAQKMKSFPL